MNWEEFENALSWFKSAPSRWVASGKKDLSAMAEWILGVIEGDFAEETSLGQAAVGTIIGMIPGVGQITDVRDIVANGLKIKSEPSNKWHWFAMLLCLIALFPTLGGLVKGSFKVVFAYGRKGIFAAGMRALDTDLWKATEPFVEAGLRKLADFLARPEVRRALSALKIDNPYKYLAEKLRTLSGSVSVGMLVKAFDSAMEALASFIEMVQRWGTAAMKTRAGQLLEDLQAVRKQADAKLGEVLKPAQDWLNRLAQRLDVEWRLKYGATVNVPNPHGLKVAELEELEQAQKGKAPWIDVAQDPKYKALGVEPSIPAGWPDIGSNGPKGLTSAFETFHDLAPVELPPGTVIYRVLAPKSFDNSICWMLEDEFKKLHSKADWRRRLAVLLNWNVNGEYLTYKVPGDPLKDKGLRVWKGRAASQPLKVNGAIQTNTKGEAYWLEGGGVQIVVNPKDLDSKFASARMPTGWGYDELNVQANLIGVPILQTQWRP